MWVDLSHAGCGIVEKKKMVCDLLKQEYILDKHSYAYCWNIYRIKVNTN